MKSITDITDFFYFIGGLIILAGVCVMGYQAFGLLKYGEWESFSIINALAYLYDWANYPTDWIGVYNLLNFIPLSLTLMTLGLFVATLSSAIGLRPTEYTDKPHLMTKSVSSTQPEASTKGSSPIKPEPVQDVEPKSTGELSKDKQTVLLVEHDNFLSELIGPKINKAGFNVFLLPNASGDFVKKVIKVGPSIIITNILMPGRNGFEAIKILMEDQHTRNIPIIVLSNFSTPDSITRAKILGVKSFLISANTTPDDIIREIIKFT